MAKTKVKKSSVQVENIDPQEYKDCVKYIAKYWDSITCEHPNDHYIHLGLPNKFICPNDGIYKNDQFYWDSYFIILALVVCDKVDIAKGMVDNFIALQKRFNIIPMRNRYYNLGSSQMPFLTSMIKEVYHVTQDLEWYKTSMLAAEYELRSYWMNTSLTEVHIVYKGLSRFCDHYITHLAAEHESGWDMTSRFKDRCLDYLPIDLNCALYKYETDLAEFYKTINDKAKYDQYVLDSEKRRKSINKLMWNFEKGFFFDYNYKIQYQSSFYSLAGFYPLWAKLATYTQARKVVDNIKIFEYKGGLANTQPKGLSREYKQHDYPNGWPHQHWIVIKGLMNYGYRQEAIRLSLKFLDLCKNMYEKTGKFWEKYNVVKCKVADSERYDTQPGFAWTNAVFMRLIKKFETPQL